MCGAKNIFLRCFRQGVSSGTGWKTYNIWLRWSDRETVTVYRQTATTGSTKARVKSKGHDRLHQFH